MLILQTERLQLRTFNEADIDAMTRINQDPKVCEFLPAIGDRNVTAAQIHRFIEHQQQHGFSLYAVELKSDPHFLGWTGLLTPNFSAPFMPAVEIGWRLSSAHWNQGYATEAATAVANHAFDNLGLTELVSFTVAQNKASRRVMEKIGMRHDSSGDFDHPKLEPGHPLQRHVLYRLQKP